MKPVQVMLDEKLLQLLANSEEVRKRGRSAVVRQAVLEYLKRVEHDEISRRYRKAYSRTATIEKELDGWEEEGEWPED